MVLTNADTTIFHNSQLFNLKIKPWKETATLYMQLFTPIVNTRYLPKTISIIKKVIPSVLETYCYNEDDLPFNKEVKATEIGHLFEHILLENLCLEKIKNGFKNVEYNGNTKWNWLTNPYGSFEITIDTKNYDIIYLIKALKKSIETTELVLRSEPQINNNSQRSLQKHVDYEYTKESNIWLYTSYTP